MTTEGLEGADELYRENILDHYKHPHNFRVLTNPSCIQRQHNPLCGDDITLFLTLTDTTITEATFQGQGCAISQAAASMLTDELKGKAVEAAENMTQEDILRLLAIPIGPVRLKCALLPLNALKQALDTCTDKEKHHG